MASLNYNTTVEWDLEVINVGTNEESLAIDGQKTTAGAPANTPKHWVAGAMVINIADGQWYRNAGTTASPNFVVAGSGGGGSPAGLSEEVQYNNAGVFGADGDFIRDPNGTYFMVRSQFAPTEAVLYLQDQDLFGIGIDGVFNGYSPDNFVTSFIGTLAGDFTGIGGADNSMIVGYQSFSGGAVANTNYLYNSNTNEAQTRIEASTLTHQARINLEADGSVETIEFDYGGSNKFKFPVTQPTIGTALGYVSANTLGWVPVGGGGGLNIGDPITGGGANRILYEDGSNNLAESSNFAYNDVTGVFSVSFGGGTRLLVDPANGLYGIGDYTGVDLKNAIYVHDSSGLISNQFSTQYQVIDATTAYQYIKIASGDVEIRNFGTGNLITVGDAGGDGNGTRQITNDFGKSITSIADIYNWQSNAGGSFTMQYNGPAQIFAVSDSLNNTGLSVNAASQEITAKTDGVFNVTDTSNNKIFQADSSIREVSLGDIAGANAKLVVNQSGNATINVIAGRFEQARGTMVTAANNLTLGQDGNVFFVDGSTTINLIERTNWQNGSEVTLMLPGGITLKHNFSPSGSFNPMILAGGVDLTTLNDTVIKLLYTNGLWYQSAGAVSQP